MVARRYAVALADVVLKNGQTETVKAELKDWETMIAANEELKSVFENPALTHESKERILNRLLERSRPSATTANFLKILLRNGRLSQLAEINERFAMELEERSGVVTARVTSARDIPGSEREDLRASLERLTGKKVNLKFDINEQLIGGVVTRIGSTVYDGSVKTQLENLKQQLVNG